MTALPPRPAASTALILLLCGAPAWAQDLDGVDSQRHRPAVGVSPSLVMPVLPAETGGGVDLIADGAGPSLVREDPLTGATTDVVGTQASTWLGAHWGGARWRAAAWLPLRMVGASSESAGLGLGDVRVQGDFRMTRARSDQSGLSLIGALELPSGDAERNLGAAGPRAELTVLGSQELGPFTLAAQAGVRSGTAAPEASVPVLGPAFLHRAAVRLDVGRNAVASLEYDGQTGIPDGSGPVTVDAASGELLAGLQLLPGDGSWRVRMGGGAGIQPGVGTPPWRAVVGLSRSLTPPDRSLAPQPVAAARKDGTLTVKVTDPAGNALDARVKLEGPEGVRDWSLLDGELARDLPPGAYALSIRAKGFVPVEKAFTVEPGGEVLFDTVLTTGKVRVEQDRVVLTERIFFQFNSATIDRASFPLLAELTAVLLQHPELERIAIQGHTDEVGDETANLSLSLARAESVREFLVASGVAENRLKAVGFGEHQPLVKGDSDAARAANRRVEFRILRRADDPNASGAETASTSALPSSASDLD